MSDIPPQNASGCSIHDNRDSNCLRYLQYQSSLASRHLPLIRDLISHDLSEPYSIYVYRYFLYQWGDLCFMVCSEAAINASPALVLFWSLTHVFPTTGHERGRGCFEWSCRFEA